MAEVAGLVLAGIPLVIKALENYRKCLDPVKGYLRYDSTLSTIRSNVFIQQQQLDVTLRNLGLDNSTPSQLERHLRAKYPDKYSEFMTIIGQMDTIIKKLMDKLEIDIQGKPRLTDRPPDRADWEWRRVKRSFNRTERSSLIDELQYWNNGLRNCFERPEIPSDESDPMVQELQAHFDPKHCELVREHARAIHEALEAGWNCICSHPHRANLNLDWHSDNVSVPAVFNLALSFRHPANGQISASQEGWQKISIKVEEDSGQQAVSAVLTPALANLSLPANLPPIPSKRVRLPRFLSSSNESQASQSAILTPPATPNAATATSTPTQISSLCRIIENVSSGSTCLGYLPSPNSTRTRRAHIISSHTKHPDLVETLPLRLLLPPHQPSPTLELSRKQRFGIAAATAWAILHLCGSPWLSETWNKDEIYLFLEKSAVGLQTLAKHPCVSRTFDQAASCARAIPAATPAERFQSNQIRNKTLFALGILLIELCINRPFEIRKDYQTGNTQPTAPDDYEIANQQTDQVYLDAGDSYGYAVQRCLRCEFPGRDVTKSFDFSQFRRHFYNGVVAPIQATFSMVPASCSLV